MAFCDFVVHYDPNKDSLETLTEKILYSIWVKRLKSNKPVTAFIGGNSGEGKSSTVIRLQEILCKIQGLDHKEVFDIINVFTPLQYPEKLNAILFDKKYKKVNMITMHEARDIVRSKNWQSFLTQAVADANAQARSIKRLMTFVISQFIRDITPDMRYTLDYYCIVRRPRGRKARLTIHVLWKDDRDLDKPKLRKRKLSGYLVMPNGSYQRFIPQYLEMSLPEKQTVQKFEELDKNAKADILRKKLDRLLDEMKQEIGIESNKVLAMVDYYVKNQEALSHIGKTYRGRWMLTKEAREMHDITPSEAKNFEQLMKQRLATKGQIKQKELKEEEDTTKE